MYFFNTQTVWRVGRVSGDIRTRALTNSMDRPPRGSGHFGAGAGAPPSHRSAHPTPPRVPASQRRAQERGGSMDDSTLALLHRAGAQLEHRAEGQRGARASVGGASLSGVVQGVRGSVGALRAAGAAGAEGRGAGWGYLEESRMQGLAVHAKLGGGGGTLGVAGARRPLEQEMGELRIGGTSPKGRVGGGGALR